MTDIIFIHYTIVITITFGGLGMVKYKLYI